jgi:hypothetical protein
MKVALQPQKSSVPADSMHRVTMMPEMVFTLKRCMESAERERFREEEHAIEKKREEKKLECIEGVLMISEEDQPFLVMWRDDAIDLLDRKSIVVFMNHCERMLEIKKMWCGLGADQPDDQMEPGMGDKASYHPIGRLWLGHETA